MANNNIQELGSFDLSIFEIVDGKINLTKIASHFGKRINDWTKTKQTKAFLEAFSDSLAETNIIVSLKGGNNEQGSFTEYREVALEFARWISPKFAVWTNKQIDTLLQTGRVELQPKKDLTTLDILKLATSEIEKLSQELEATKTTLDHKQAVILELAEKVPAITMRNTINRVVRDWAAKNGYQYHFAWTKLYTEFKYVYSVDLKTRAENSKQSAIQIAENIGQLENLYLLSLKMYEVCPTM